MRRRRRHIIDISPHGDDAYDGINIGCGVDRVDG